MARRSTHETPAPVTVAEPAEAFAEQIQDVQHQEDTEADFQKTIMMNLPISLFERMVRVEEALRGQNERFVELIDHINQRAEESREETNRQFDEMNQRVEDNQHHIEKRIELAHQESDAQQKTANRWMMFWFALITVLITLYRFIGGG